ncbi:uncharacterized protein LOC133197846 [Saccostrea echinata]|uniref:uncharacterized protein LOC133197846 n=1 Tax=Saccostrea echinata TaxID=191078 RepID=UPI002A822D26|nr:uncharacterized protein LOC133197846 [Saccostrea echinata]
MAIIQEDNKELNQKIDKVLMENKRIKRDMEDQSKANALQEKKISKMEHTVADMQKTLKNCEIQKTSILNTGQKILQKEELFRHEDNHTAPLINGTTFDNTQAHNLPEKLNIYNEQRRRVQRLLMTDIPPTPADCVAFFSFMSKSENHPGQHQTIIFDVAHTNVGSNYSPHTGAFTAPKHGVYAFTWKIYASSGGFIFTDLVVNSNSVSGSFAGAQSVSTIVSSTDMVILELNQGDEVHIRTQPDVGVSGILQSTRRYRSTFNGWKLF